ncbi:MAG: hypothetical protein SFU55_09860 [Methylophilus sp.]|nr:hypothetical protein [Methylophilus sp.]
MPDLNKLFALFIGLSIATCTPAAGESIPNIDARFETIQCEIPCKKPQKRIWWMLRSATQIELRDVGLHTGKLAKFGEIWRHQADNKLSYLFLMYEDKRAIEYLPDDLKILGISADEKQWQIITQLITDDEVAHMKKTSVKSEFYHRYQVESYVGMINDTRVSVLWLPQLHIPAKIVYYYPKPKNSGTKVPETKITVQLKQLSTELASSIRTSESQLSSYQQVYYTDIGDMEQNAEAQAWITKAKGAPGLHTHQH